MSVLRIFRQTFVHLNQRGYLYVWANILWVLLSLPLVTAPAAWAGLVHFSYCARTERQVALDDFWTGFKRSFRQSLIIGGITLVILVVNLTNLTSFVTGDAWVDAVLRGVWLSAILLWLSLVLYLFPLLEAMATPTLPLGLRNAALMLLQNPIFTLGLWAGMIPLVGLSTVLFPAWLLLTGSTLAGLWTTAVLDRLRAAGYPLRTVDLTADVADGAPPD